MKLKRKYLYFHKMKRVEYQTEDDHTELVKWMKDSADSPPYLAMKTLLSLCLY